MSAARAMAENDGSETNETVLWNVFANVFGEEARKEKGEFDGYYAEGFKVTREACGQDPRVPDIVRSLKERGCRVVLATNPMFPMHAMVMRIGWAGLEPSDFDLITSYEDFRHAKPNPGYYLEIAERIGIPPEECVMVGNDADEDLSASSVGMDVFLLTDCMVNRSGKDLSDVPKGDLDDLRTYLDEMTP